MWGSGCKFEGQRHKGSAGFGFGVMLVLVTQHGDLAYEDDDLTDLLTKLCRVSR